VRASGPSIATSAASARTARKSPVPASERFTARSLGGAGRGAGGAMGSARDASSPDPGLGCARVEPRKDRALEEDP
jgi:hypothetical protein